MKTIDFSTVADGKAEADRLIAKSGLAITSLHALYVQESGVSFPASVEFVNRVKERLVTKAERVTAAHGEDAIV